MGKSSSIEVSYRCEQGWHIFEAAQMPGLYIAHQDPRRAFNAVGPAIEKLVKLDSNLDVQVAPEMPFADFVGNARAALVGTKARQRFNLFQAAA